jgi:hypothetical protein
VTIYLKIAMKWELYKLTGESLQNLSQNKAFMISMGWGCSIVFDYRLDDRGLIPSRGKGFLL